MISVFANYQNGFTNISGVDYQSKTFKPEQANQIEGGVKLNAFDGRLSSMISYYEYYIGYSTANPQQLRSFAGTIAYKF